MKRGLKERLLALVIGLLALIFNLVSPDAKGFSLLDMVHTCCGLLVIGCLLFIAFSYLGTAFSLTEDEIKERKEL